MLLSVDIWLKCAVETPADPEVEAFLESKRAEVDADANKYVGYSLVELSGDKEDCRFSECAFGDLLADAVTKYFILRKYNKTTSDTSR